MTGQQPPAVADGSPPLDLQQLQSPGLLEKIVEGWVGAQLQRMHIVNYNGAQLSYTAKADVANKMGLSEQQKLNVTPFPSPMSLAITQPPADTGAAEEKAWLQNELTELKKKVEATEPSPAKAVATAAPGDESWGSKALKYAAVAVLTGAAAVAGMKALSGGGEPQKEPVAEAPVAGKRDDGNSSPTTVTNITGTGEGTVDVEVEGWLNQQ